jgi:hypothetical protein
MGRPVAKMSVGFVAQVSIECLDLARHPWELSQSSALCKCLEFSREQPHLLLLEDCYPPTSSGQKGRSSVGCSNP